MTSNNPSKRLFVGSLPFRYTEGELLSIFIQFGKIIAVRIVKNRWGKSRGMGYVEFEDIDNAINAKKQLHNHFVEDRSIIVDYAQPDPFETIEGKQRHLEAQERRPLEKRKYLDEFGNRKPIVARPPQEHPEVPRPGLNRPEPFHKRFGGSSRTEQITSEPIVAKKTYKGGKPVFNVLGRSLNKSEEYVPRFVSEVSPTKKKFIPKKGQKPEYKASVPTHVRSSVFKQRKFGSKVGAKFAFKGKKSR